MTRLAPAFALLLLLACAAPARAAPSLVPLGSFDHPTYATSPPGDQSRIFVTEKPGRVRLLDGGTLRAAPFLDLSGITESGGEEQGLLSIAFPPDYAASGRFYVYLTVTAAAAQSGTDGEIQVRSYQRSATDPDVADPASGRVVLAIQHSEATNHDGGQLQFGPDGRLYAGTGDGGGENDQYHHAQDTGSMLGKLLAADVSQPSPSWSILAVGLRNPWRFSFDPSGRIVIGDVGQDAWEEIDVGLAGNYGWPCLEGNTPYRSDPGCAGVPTAAPFLVHSHSGDGFCSIVGGYVITDPGLPTLLNRYLYGDYCKGDLRTVSLADARTDAATGLNVPQLSSFGEDACGRILVVSLAGTVSRLLDGALSPCTTPPGGGGGPGAPPPRDTRAPRISVNVTGLRSVRRRHYLKVLLRPDESCRATVSAKIRHVAFFKHARRSPVAGRRTTVKLKLSKKGRRAVRRALRRHHRLRVTVRLQARDAAGNALTYAHRYRVRG